MSSADTSASTSFRDKLLAILVVLVSVQALRIAYPVAMPLAFSAVIVAALWPVKSWGDRRMGSPGGYLLAISVFLVCMGGFAAAVYFSIGQVTQVIAARWGQTEQVIQAAAKWASAHGVAVDGTLSQQRAVGAVRMLAAKTYAFVTYAGLIALLVMLGLPEVGQVQKRVNPFAGEGLRRIMATGEKVSGEVLTYLSTMSATSLLTGLGSAGIAIATGLDLPLVWGLLNFLLNFIPVIGNVVGILPPVLYSVLQFDGWTMPALVFGGFVALQVAISNFVYPLLQGRRLSLSPLAIILAMSFWSWAWGLAGALIAAPLSAAGVLVCERFDRTRWLAALLSTSPPPRHPEDSGPTRAAGSADGSK